MINRPDEVVDNLIVYFYIVCTLVVWYGVVQPNVISSPEELIQGTVVFPVLDVAMRSLTHIDVGHLLVNILVFSIAAVTIIPFVKPDIFVVFTVQVVLWGYILSYIQFGTDVGFSSEASAFCGISAVVFVRNYLMYMDNKKIVKSNFELKYRIMYCVLVFAPLVVFMTDILIAIGLIPYNYSGPLSTVIGTQERSLTTATSHSMGLLFGILVSTATFSINKSMREKIEDVLSEYYSLL